MDMPANARSLKTKRGLNGRGKRKKASPSRAARAPGKPAVPRLSVVLCIRESRAFHISGRVFFPSLFAKDLMEAGLAAEIIVVDSSAKAEIADTIREAVESFGGVYVRDEPASRKYSLARARNRGVAAARGEFVLLADIDLVPPPGFMKNLAAFLERGRLARAQNHFSIVPVFYLRDDACPDALSKIQNSSLTDWLHGENARLVSAFQMVNSTLLLRRGFYRLLGGQHEGFRGWGMEDWHFLWKLMSFPQPVPGPPTQTPFHRNPPQARNELKSWRDAAWFISDEALRHGLYLFHMPHEMRTDGWRSTSADNNRRFDALVEDRAVFEAPPCLKTGGAYRVYSEDPAIANALLFPPDAQVTAGRPGEIDGLALRLRTGETARPVIGAAQPDAPFYRQFERLSDSGRPFDFLYPSGVPQALFCFSHESGNIRCPRRMAEPLPCDLTQTYDLDTTAINAHRFRHSGWRRDKLLILFVLSEDREETCERMETAGGPFGLSAAGFRSLVNALIPLFDGGMAAMIHEFHSGRREGAFPSEGAHDVSDQQLDFLINAADVVVTQSPRFALNAAVIGKPVITTGTLFADILPGVPVARTLFDVYAFINAMRAAPQVVSPTEIEAAMARACIHVADNRGAPAPADLLHRRDVARVLYEQVATPDHAARFEFASQPEETELLAWLWPHLSETSARQHHLALVHDPWFNRASSVGFKKAAPGSAGPAGPAMNPRFAASDAERRAMYRNGSPSGSFSRKLAKLKRNPHRFFADTKNPALRSLKILFPAR